MTPKSLLRNPRASSSLNELAEVQFQPVLGLGAEAPNPEEVTRLVLCSGKVAIDLLASGELKKANGNVDILRIELLYPYPEEELQFALARYPQLQEVVWLQEEPQNMGAWNYIAPKLRATIDPAISISYVGRAESASPAEGLHSAHVVEQQRILREAVQGAPVPVNR
jgi:2-oxoglutarate dehydrogenase E1 component (EC 1.2.4.2)